MTLSAVSDSWEFIDQGDEDTPPSPKTPQDEPSVAEDKVDKDEDVVTKDQNMDRRPVRRLRSKDEEENLEDDKEKMDERGPKKSKKDKDNRDQHRHPSRPAVVRPTLSKMKTLEDFGYEFNAGIVGLFK